MKKKPTVYWLRWSKADGAWVLYRGRTKVDTYVTHVGKWPMTKRDATDCAVIEVRGRWSALNEPTQLRICAKDGRIIAERSYGSDRRDRKG